MPYPLQPLLPRLVDRMEIDGECWIYTGNTTPGGYGHISYNNQIQPVHRLAYEQLVEPIPDGLVLDHLCRRPPCFNPDHLEPVTTQVNVLRGEGAPAAYAARTHCGNGHEFTEANTYQRQDGNGRKCRTCQRDYMRAWRAARKDVA
jgi:hypothetical protein